MPACQPEAPCRDRHLLRATTALGSRAPKLLREGKAARLGAELLRVVAADARCSLESNRQGSFFDQALNWSFPTRGRGSLFIVSTPRFSQARAWLSIALAAKLNPCVFFSLLAGCHPSHSFFYVSPAELTARIIRCGKREREESQKQEQRKRKSWPCSRGKGTRVSTPSCESTTR
jgi:hypothetical protein